jgi:hypothetical protein
MARPQENPNGSRSYLPAKASPPRPAAARRLLAADPDVVLRIAGGIVRIAAGIVRAEVRLSGGIDRLIGVAAAEHERRKSQKDRDPHSRPPVQWRRGRRTREFGAGGDRVQVPPDGGAVFTKALRAMRPWSGRLAAAATPGVVLCVADGIVRIVVLVVAGEDLGGRLRRGIDRLIGVAAAEHERHNSQNDRDPHSRPQFNGDEAGARDSLAQSAIGFNSSAGSG